MEQIIEEFHYPKLNDVSDDVRYWFNRTYSGSTFNHFLKNNYIGLGLNEIPFKLIENAKNSNPVEVDILKTFLEVHTDYQKGMATRIAHALIAFQGSMKIGDRIVIPSKDSDFFAIGTIAGDVYQVEKPKTFEWKNGTIEYPARRRKVDWHKIVNRKEIDVPLVGSGNYTALNSINKFEQVIESCIDSLYTKGNKTFFTLNIKQNEDINAFLLNSLLENLIYFYQQFTISAGEIPDKELFIKIKLQSQGKAYLAGLAMTGMIGVATMVYSGPHENVIEQMQNKRIEGQPIDTFKTYGEFFQEDPERLIRYNQLQNAMKALQAEELEKSLIEVNPDSIKPFTHNVQAEGEENNGDYNGQN